MDKSIMLMLLGFGIPAIVGISVMLFGKFLPKQETYDNKIKPAVQTAARWLSKLLNLKLGKASAEKIEEGVFVTVAYWIDQASRDFIAALIEDNK